MERQRASEGVGPGAGQQPCEPLRALTFLAPEAFAEKRADLGFLCSSSFLYLRSQATPSIELVPTGFVFSDECAKGGPVYFSEVVVRADHRARELAELGCSEALFGRRVRTGSHDASVAAILAGSVDGAAIDSTVLARMRRERPELGLERMVPIGASAHADEHRALCALGQISSPASQDLSS